MKNIKKATLLGTRINKLLLSLVFLCLSTIIYIWHSIYPLTLYEEMGYLFQIPYYYWLAISILLLLMLAINMVYNKPYISYITSVAAIFILSFYNFLVFGTAGGGWITRVIALVRDNAHLSSDLPYTYRDFDTPSHYIFHRIQYLIVEYDMNAVEAIEIAFLSYVVVFASAIWIFIYSNVGDELYSYMGSIILFSTMLPMGLRFRYVPQFLALILLIYLFYFHSFYSKRTRGISMMLFLSLLLAHPVLYMYYLIPLMFSPIILAAMNSFPDHARNDHNYIFLKQLFGTNFLFIRRFISNLKPAISIKNRLLWSATLVSIFLLVFMYRWERTQQTIVGLLVRQDRADAARLISRLLGMDISYDSRYEEVPTYPLYDITSQTVSEFTTTLMIVILLSFGLSLTILSLIRRFRTLDHFYISVMVISGMHFIMASFQILPHGRRAFQILFIPFVLSISALKYVGSSAYTKRVVAATIFIILIISIAFVPVMGANYMNNQELVGGDRTPNYYTERGGQLLNQYEFHTAIQPPATHYPDDPYGERDRIHIGATILDGRYGSEHTITSDDHIQYDPRLYLTLQRYGYYCDLKETNKIVDIHESSSIIQPVEESIECSNKR